VILRAFTKEKGYSVKFDGEGTVQLNCSRKCSDAHNNIGFGSDTSAPVKFDNTPAQVEGISFTSNNTENDNYAKKGDTLSWSSAAERFTRLSGKLPA
jgi:hypothetical protein